MIPTARWFTLDYGHWVEDLIISLDQFEQPHYFVEMPKERGSSWEVNTLRKAQCILDAMDRHPDKVIVFLDVDRIVRGDLSPLAEIGGDIGFYVQMRRRKNGAIRFRVRSGTLVIKPTPIARRFVEIWSALSACAHYGDNDQTTLMLALGHVPNLKFRWL